MRTTRRFIGGLAGAATALLFSAATAIGEESTDWNYDDPTKWKESYEACGKPIQSPIAIIKPTHIKRIVQRSGRAPTGSPVGYATPTIPLKVKNDGHTVEVEADGANFTSFGRLEKVCGPGAQQSCKEYYSTPFYLKQMHFYAPSEHTMRIPVTRRPKGSKKDAQIGFPLEAHFVHESRDKTRLAVLAVMFKAGKENTALAGLVSNLSKLTGTATNYEGSINLTQLMPPVADNGYWPAGYHYWGSKTTPACAGGIFWYVFRDPVEASQAQIDALATAMKKNNRPNNRPIQPLNDRYIGYYYEDGDED